MIQNYLLIALRTLRRRRGYAFINIAGLAVGMACCVLILLFVRDELGYDRHLPDAERLVRLQTAWGGFSLPSTNLPMLRAVEDAYPDLLVAPLLNWGGRVGYEPADGTPVQFQEDDLFMAEPSFFELFGFEMIEGTADVLAEPYQVIMSESAARRYFGDADPLGQTIRLYNQIDATVAGIAADTPAQTHFNAEVIASWSTLQAATQWEDTPTTNNNGVYVYLRLPEGTAPADFDAQLATLIDERFPGDEWNGSTLTAQPVVDIHLHSTHNMELAANSDAAYVTLFLVIAGFILLVACVNFMNLATARSADRAREVGVRKAIGARRGQLVGQFLAESVVLTVVALVIAVALVAAVLPTFEVFAGRPLDVSLLDLPVIGGILGIALVTGVLAGSYPAVFLAGFRPAQVLRGAFRSSRQGATLRKGLVVFQFVVSAGLILATLVVYNQLQFLQSTSLGFDQERVVVVPAGTPGELSLTSFIDALESQPGVAHAAASSEPFPSELLDGTGTFFEVADPDAVDRWVPTRTISVGHGFFETVGVEMLHGRAFDRARPADSSGFVLNETAAQQLVELSEGRASTMADLIGMRIGSNGVGPLLGIVKDFNMSTLHEAIEPMVFSIDPSDYNHVVVRLDAGDPATALASLRETWPQFFPNHLLEVTFADQGFAAQYAAEARLGRLFLAFSLLAVVVACLGLFGLASFTAEQRRKEIGVRKVLGARVPGLVALLSRETALLVAVGFALAVPLAWLGMSRWLDGFAYRTEIGVSTVALAGLVAVTVALSTVSIQALRAATANPVDSLRSE
ncbi:MAG: ABC transporter permease [Bacteroidota bacterium]